MLTVIIPANNEADYIGACLTSVLASDPSDAPFQIIVAANGCTDATPDIARGFSAEINARGWTLIVLDIAQAGKLNALNLAEAAATPGANRAYLDADVRVSPPLLAQIDRALCRPDPAYASGRPVVSYAKTRVTRAYSRIWTRLPFMQQGVPGCGLFAVNPAGRARWGVLPDIISDDTFVRLHFTPDERIGVPGTFVWPMVDGFANLVKVRTRQDAGVRQVARLFPDLMQHDEKHRVGPARLAGLFLTDPIGFSVYSVVSVAVRLTLKWRVHDVLGGNWARGR